jgi:DNA-binding transcriptional MocR family regulator
VWGGIRLGWIRASVSLLQRLARVRTTLDLAGPILDQLVALELVAELDELLAERRRLGRERLEALAGALARELPAWRFERPEGGLVLWAQIDRSSTTLARAAEAEGVRLVPGPRFGTDGTLDRFLRVPFVLPAETLVDAVARIARASRSVPPFAGREREPALVV